MQSQDFAGSAWGIAQRCADLDEVGFRAAFDAGALVRTHVLRPTWHLVAPADLRTTLSQTAQRALESAARRYGRFLGEPLELKSGRIDA